MSEATKITPIVIVIPDYGLSPEQLKALEVKWAEDLVKAVSATGAKMFELEGCFGFHIKVGGGKGGK